MLKVITKKLGFHRNNRRFYEDNSAHLSVTGFQIGDRLSIVDEGERVIICRSPDGKHGVSQKSQRPVIDINNSLLTKALGEGASEEQVTYQKHRIVIEKQAIISKATARCSRILDKVKKGLPIAVASLYTGLGMLDIAAADGLAVNHLSAEHVWVNEYDSKIVEHAVKHNAAIYEQASVFNQDIRSFSAGQLQQPDILLIGQPCLTQSSLNTNKENRGILHDTAGDLFFHSLRVIQECNPAIVVLENSPNFIKNNLSFDTINAQSVEFFMFKKVLESLNYNISVRKVSGGEIGMMEKRERTCFVAVTKGINLDITELTLKPLAPSCLGDYLDPTIGPDSPLWKPYTYLENNNPNTNFKAVYNTPSDTRTGILNASYAKVQRDTCVILHPTNPELKRILTVEEHARVKGFSTDIVSSANLTLGHRMLGNGVQRPVWEQVFAFIGKTLTAATRQAEPLPSFSIPAGVNKRPQGGQAQLDLFAA